MRRAGQMNDYSLRRRRPEPLARNQSPSSAGRRRGSGGKRWKAIQLYDAKFFLRPGIYQLEGLTDAAPRDKTAVSEAGQCLIYILSECLSE